MVVKLNRYKINALQVEFPEARIYEETLNVLLYEHRDNATGPDAELLAATRGYPTGSASGHHSDDDGEERFERMDRFRRTAPRN